MRSPSPFENWLQSELHRWAPGGVTLQVNKNGDQIQAISGVAISGPDHTIRPDTLFDCASLTKPLITASLARRIGVSPEEPIRLPGQYAAFPHGVPTVGEALAHTTGMPRWLPIYGLSPDPSEALRLLPSKQVLRPGTATEYSCPGFILLGHWLELKSGRTLPELVQEHILEPLGLGGEAFFPLSGQVPLERVAATELGNRIEREMSGGSAPVRPSPIWGEVHDGNSRFLGGAAGNAGLFATARAVFRLAEAAWIVPDRPLPPGTFWNGWKAGGEGTCFPEGTLGHTGFTGTSVCLHLREEAISVLLTNRLHQEDPPDLCDLRKQFHTASVNFV